MRGRYVGPIETTFESPVGTVLPGAEFTIPTGRERAFLQHGYVEPADKAAKDFVAKSGSASETPTDEQDTSSVK